MRAFAVIPTRDRPGMLADCIASVIDQVDGVYVVDNGSDPPFDPAQWAPLDGGVEKVFCARVPEDPPNLSHLWNIGLGLALLAHQHAGGQPWEPYDVLVLNDDVVCPPNLVATLSAEMRATRAVMAYPDQHGGRERILHTVAGPMDLRQRITGFAFLLRGEALLRADEDLAWWYGDDDLDWRAREAGGSLLVPGVPVEHRCPNGFTDARPELREQAARDRETFRTKWGRTPW
jgi:glycosyltransferase involved in cell wall biosynthesis